MTDNSAFQSSMHLQAERLWRMLPAGHDSPEAERVAFLGRVRQFEQARNASRATLGEQR